MAEPHAQSRAAWRAMLLALAPLALLFVVFMCAGAVLAPPPLRADNPAGRFDAVAAQQRLARILGDEAPHPVDSAAQDVVRAALLREIAALGFAPAVHESFACRPQPRGPLIDCALVRNIVFSSGPQSGPAVLAATHYDSVPAAPGASDAGIGIAVWLEAARLMRDEQLARRVIFLISDGEEPALLGAQAFTRDPLFADVEALVNLEARGSRGPAIFFESNPPNADAVAAFSAAPRPIANSVMADIYQLLPNSTDVTALRRPGLDIVNIALLDGLEDYHTPQDSLASFNTRSLQHMGDMVLATTRAFAHAPDGARNTPLVYTDIASYGFLSAPAWAGQAVLALAALVAFAAFWRTGAGARWRAFAAPPAALALAGGGPVVVALVLGVARPGEDYWFAHPEPTRAWCALLALLAIVAALQLLRAGRDPAQAGAAGAFWFAAIGFGAAIALPGLSILFALPAVFYAAGAIIALGWRPAQAVGAGLAALAAAAIWAPTLHLVELALGFDLPAAIAVLMAVMSLTWLGAIARAGAGSWGGATVVLAAAALAAVVAAALVPSMTPQRPRSLNISYFFDATTGEARVLAGSARRALPRQLADAFAFAPEIILPGDQQPTWAASADAAPTPTPALAGLMLAEEDGRHVARARLAMNGAYRVVLRLPRAQTPMLVAVNGVEASFADTGPSELDYVNLACQGRACDGAEIALYFTAAPRPQDWFVIGQYPGAPAGPARAAIARRPASATPIQFGDGVVTLSRAAP